MSLIFWRSENKTGSEVEHGPAQQVNEQHPLPTGAYYRREGSQEYEEVSDGHPLPVFVPPGSAQVAVSSRLVQIGPTEIPGIGTGSAYAANDAMGTTFTLDVPCAGAIVKAFFYDLDDEGIGKELWLLAAPFTAAADNGAFSLDDPDILKVVGVLIFNNFRDAANNQISDSAQTPLWYKVPSGKLYCQVKTLGADNIVAGSLPKVSLLIESYDPDFAG